MTKPDQIAGYDEELTNDCERVLVTLLRGLGPWKESICLIGGLTPRYLVKERPPVVPRHAGTQDVDIVVALQILADTKAYHSLEDNFKKMGFERAPGASGRPVSWRWQTRTEKGKVLLLELLADAPDISGGKVQELPTEGTVSALNIPHSSIVFDMYEEVEVTAELMNGAGIATEKVKHANLVAFTCLKAFAFDHRFERKDAHDMIYCIENTAGGMEVVVAAFMKELEGKHVNVIREALAILYARFASHNDIEGYKKDGPVATARFEHGDSTDAELRDLIVLRQRQASDTVELLLKKLGE